MALMKKPEQKVMQECAASPYEEFGQKQMHVCARMWMSPYEEFGQKQMQVCVRLWEISI